MDWFLVWFMNDERYESHASSNFLQNTLWKIVGTSDFNNDETTDILLRNGETGKNCVLFMDGAEIESGAWLETVEDINWKIVGTGDFTHPKWLKELTSELKEENETNLYHSINHPESKVRFMLTGEVCTSFYDNEKSRRIHHVIFSPNFETVTQINERLAHYGNLSVDGRPFLNMTASNPRLIQ